MPFVSAKAKHKALWCASFITTDADSSESFSRLNTHRSNQEAASLDVGHLCMTKTCASVNTILVASAPSYQSCRSHPSGLAEHAGEFIHFDVAGLELPQGPLSTLQLLSSRMCQISLNDFGGPLHHLANAE